MSKLCHRDFIQPTYYVHKSAIQTLKQELSGTGAYKETYAEEISVVNDHCSQLPLKFSVNMRNHQNKLVRKYVTIFILYLALNYIGKLKGSYGY